MIRELVMTEDEGTAEEDSACRVVDSWTLGGLDGMPVLEAERGLGDLTAQCVSTIDELATETTNGFYEHFSWLGNGASVEGRWLLSTRASDHTAALVRTRYGDESYDVLVVLWAEADGTCVLAAEFGDPVIVAGPDVPHQWDEHFVSVSRPQGDGGDA